MLKKLGGRSILYNQQILFSLLIKIDSIVGNINGFMERLKTAVNQTYKNNKQEACVKPSVTLQLNCQL